MRNRNRYISLLLCLSMFFSMIVHSVPTVLAAEKSVKITLEGQQIDNVVIEQEDKKTLSAITGGIEAPSFQWQILLDPQNAVWVNIYDRTEQNCEISYALVKNMLDDANSTYIRCAATSAGETVFSNEVCVTVKPEQQSAPQVTAFEQTRYVSTEDPAASDAADVFSMSRNVATDYVTITVKYLDIASLNGTEEAAIYSPYTATIVRDTSFKQSVVSPTFLGFSPYLDSNNDGVINDDDESAATLNLDYDSVTEDIEIKVYYRPIEVNFAVKYFFQNIHDDLYTEDASLYHTDKAETGTIISNEYLMEHAGDTTGFTKMYHIPESVAADGSTVFECYYDRNYYLIQFDLNGGYGVDPIYARYGTPFIVNDPIRHGYTFAGWKLTHIDTNGNGEWDDALPDGVSSELVSTIPSYNYCYQAQWETVDTTATVVYWLEDPDIEGKYNYWQTEEISNIISGTTIYGKDYKDITKCVWYTNTIDAAATYQFYEYNADKTENELGVIVEGDGSSVVNVYFDRKEYTLQFIFARTDGTDYQTASYTNSDNYADVDWDSRTLLTDNWNTIISSTDPICKNFTEVDKNDGVTYTYYYFEISDKYGARIDDEWTKINNLLANNPIDSANDPYVYISWRTNSNSDYGRDNISNRNIKGAYPYMDTQMIITDNDTGLVTNSTHIMTAYNNTGVSYYQYEIYIYNVATQEYVLENSFIVNPTAPYNQQTTFQYIGLTHVKTEYYDRDAEGNLIAETNITSRPDGKNSVDYPAVIRFYYDPNNYKLQFFNHNIFIDDMEQTVTYGTLLSTYKPDSEPAYPDTLEENAYIFDGWYTTHGCYAGSEVHWNTDTVPAQNSVLYANWVPQTHTVRFFTTYDDMTSFENALSDDVYFSFNVKHGETVGTVDTPVRSGDETLELTFAGWFYMENGQKKAFSPLNMPVNRDINIFAEWSSHSPQPYRISYVLQSNPDVNVADDTTGYAYGGSTRTFNAKAGDPYNQLYSDYNNGYFPTVSSHSITIQAEADEDNLEHNIFTFYYVKAENISYTIRYVNKETNAVMDTETHTTTSAVVTERFKAYPNMVPDAFYKRLVLEVRKDENGNWVGTENNVITFYYTPNDTSAYYAVHFMLEKLGATDEEKKNYDINGDGGYEETGTHIEGVGKIGSIVYITPQEISGFSLIENNSLPIILSDGVQSVAEYSSDNNGYGITITQSGTELYLFYERNEYPYQVHYYEYNTTNSLADSKASQAYFGSEVTETSVKIEGYTCVSEQTQTITIREDDGNEGMNVIIFYYAPVQYVAEYVAVTDEGGWLSSTIEIISGTETLSGSIPTANQYYEFAGWYLDEACTQDASEYGEIDSATNRFTPNKTKLSETERNIFYAKFVKNTGDFTIERNGATDDNQVFVYEIKNTDTDAVFYVTVTGNGSTTIHDLPLGKYTVTQQNDWSWRYNDEISDVNHQNANGTTVIFSKTEQKKQWLNGNSPIVKNQRSGTV